MDFLDVASGHLHAEKWFEGLHECGKTCGEALDSSPYLTDEGRVPDEYACAVAWHNIVIDDRLPGDQRRIFAEVIEAAWDDTSGRAAPAKTEVLRFYSRGEMALEGRLQEDLSAIGPPPQDISPDDDGYDLLCTMIREPPGREGSSGALDGIWPADSLLSSEEGPPIVWLTRYADLKDALEADTGADEALCRVGLESFIPSSTWYMMLVDAHEIWDDLRVPTVVDSRLYYMWAASNPEENSTGLTRHTYKGNGFGVPELVIRRKRLQDVFNKGPVGAIRTEGPFHCGSVVIPREHAKKRWHDEIASVI